MDVVVLLEHSSSAMMTALVRTSLLILLVGHGIISNTDGPTATRSQPEIVGMCSGGYKYSQVRGSQPRISLIALASSSKIHFWQRRGATVTPFRLLDIQDRM